MKLYTGWVGSRSAILSKYLNGSTEYVTYPPFPAAAPFNAPYRVAVNVWPLAFQAQLVPSLTYPINMGKWPPNVGIPLWLASYEPMLQQFVADPGYIWAHFVGEHHFFKYYDTPSTGIPQMFFTRARRPFSNTYVPASWNPVGTAGMSRPVLATTPTPVQKDYVPYVGWVDEFSTILGQATPPSNFVNFGWGFSGNVIVYTATNT